MSLDPAGSPPPSPAPSLTVRHEPAAALYAREFLVHLGDDVVFVDCSSGIVHEAAGSVLPVHTRLALSPNGLGRLHELLSRALAEQAAQAAPADGTPGPTSTAARASGQRDQVWAQFPPLAATDPRGTASCPR